MKITVMMVVIVGVVLAGTGFFFVYRPLGESEVIKFADLSWDGPNIHNRIVARLIHEHINGSIKFEFIGGPTVESFGRVAAGDLDVMMESWHSNYIGEYEKKKPDIVDLGPNFPEGQQGWWIPDYVSENLKTIQDLKDNYELFLHPATDNKGLVAFGVEGWASNQISREIFEEYGLSDYFEYLTLKSREALASYLEHNYQNGFPFVSYYWGPSYMLKELNLTLLENSEFVQAEVHKIVNPRLKNFPKIMGLLESYNTSFEQNNYLIFYYIENNYNLDMTVDYFLENWPEWKEWVKS